MRFLVGKWPTGSLAERIFPFGNHRKLGTQLGIQLRESGPFFGQVIFMEDRLDGAFRNTRFAVNALVRMDVEHLFTFVEALYGANNDAIGVLAREARLCNYVSHGSDLQFGQ